MPWWFFEGILWFFLVLVGAALIEIFTTKGWRKIKKQPTILFSVLFLFFVWSLVFYGSFIEPRTIIIKEQEISFFAQPQTPLKIVLLSDLHVGPYKGAGWIDEVVSKTNALKPDLIFLLGDYVMGQEGKLENLTSLEKLEAPLGVWAVLGNHDYDASRSEEIISFLQLLGIKVLYNSSEAVTLADNSQLVLAGVGDIWYDEDIEKTLDGLNSNEQVILLSHNPDVILDERTRIADLVVSGHTHGGQIRLPFLGPLTVPAVLGRNFDEGFFKTTVPLFITSGLGEVGPRARLFNPPEIVVLTIK